MNGDDEHHSNKREKYVVCNIAVIHHNQMYCAILPSYIIMDH
jgi:hypothetical protein